MRIPYQWPVTGESVVSDCVIGTKSKPDTIGSPVAGHQLPRTVAAGQRLFFRDLVSILPQILQRGRNGAAEFGRGRPTAEIGSARSGGIGEHVLDRRDDRSSGIAMSEKFQQ